MWKKKLSFAVAAASSSSSSSCRNRVDDEQDDGGSIGESHQSDLTDTQIRAHSFGQRARLRNVAR